MAEKQRSNGFVCTVFFLCLIQWNPIPIPIAVAILDPADFLALQSIRKSLEDMPGSKYFASWDFTSDPCNFADVYCDSDKVISLNLGDPRAGAPGLTGRLDPAIGKLSALAELSIVPGRIFGTLPQSISQCLVDLWVSLERHPRRAYLISFGTTPSPGLDPTAVSGERAELSPQAAMDLGQSPQRCDPALGLPNGHSH